MLGEGFKLAAWHLQLIGVQPELQRRGVGSKLIDVVSKKVNFYSILSLFIITHYALTYRQLKLDRHSAWRPKMSQRYVFVTINHFHTEHRSVVDHVLREMRDACQGLRWKVP